MGTAPAGNGSTVSTCSGTFLDPGGASNYGTNIDNVVTFTSSTPGNQINFLFSSIAIGTGDTLKVYNGTSISATLLYTFGPGTSLTNFSLNSYVDGALTFRFKSNGSGAAAGWSGTISCLAGCS